MTSEEMKQAVDGPNVSAKLVVDISGPDRVVRVLVDNLLRALRLFRLKYQDTKDVRVNYRLTEK